MATILPTYTTADLDTILVSKEEIQIRIAELAKELSAHYSGEHVTVISVLSGALVFTADLIRLCDFPTRLDCLRAESYGNETTASKPPRITNPLKTDIANRHVLVVDDILDTGNTMKAISQYLSQAKPASLKTCVLLDKPSRHSSNYQPDFKGFTIPDAFVVGYGLDFAENYRQLNDIGTLKKELQTLGAHT